MTIYEAGDPVTSKFGMRTLDGVTAPHNGIDVSRGPGNRQRACVPGIIAWVSVGYNYGRGNNLIIKQNTAKGVVWIRHQHAQKILVQVGQQVKATDFVATEGATGKVYGSHDHFEVVVGGVLRSDGEIVGGKVVDPSPWLHYKNAIGTYPRNDDVYDYGTGKYNTQEDENVKLKIYAPIKKVVSSAMIDQGLLGVMGADGRLRAYDLNGDARMARAYTPETLSPTFEDMRDQMLPGEIIVAVDE